MRCVVKNECFFFLSPKSPKNQHRTCAHYDDWITTTQLLHRHSARNYVDLCENSPRKAQRGWQNEKVTATTFFELYDSTKWIQKPLLTIYLQCPTLNYHKAAFARQRHAIFRPLDIGYGTSSCAAVQHCYASLREGLIGGADLDDRGRDVVCWIDLENEKEIDDLINICGLFKLWSRDWIIFDQQRVVCLINLFIFFDVVGLWVGKREREWETMSLRNVLCTFQLTLFYAR